MRRTLSLVFLLVVASKPVEVEAQAPTSKPATVRELVPIFLRQSFEAPVRYCESAAPELAASVRHAAITVRPVLERAMKDYLAWVPNTENEPVTPELAALLEKAQVQLMEEVRAKEPRSYCTALADRYLSMSSDRLLAQAKLGYENFRAMQPSNPSIERTSPGKPGAASHVKR